MKPTPFPSACHLLAALAVLSIGGCRSCERSRTPPAPAPPVSAAPAELATLDLPELATGQRAGAEPPQVEGFVNSQGTGGALVIRSGGTARLVHGHEVSQVHPQIRRVVLSPDGRKVAYSIVDPEKRFRVVFEGKPGPAFDAVDELVFTHGGHLAYKGLTGERWRLVVDHTAGEERFAIGELRAGAEAEQVVAVERASATSPIAVVAYDAQLRRKLLMEIAAEELILNADASRVAGVVDAAGMKRVVMRPLVEPGASWEGPPCDEVMSLAFDPSGTHVVYAASRGNEVHVLVDSKSERLPSPALAELPVLNPARGTAGAILMVEQSSFFHLVFGGTASLGKAYDIVADVTFSPDGSRYAHVAEEQGRGFVVVNGAEGPHFERVVVPRFSPDGRFLVYRARQEGKRFVVVADSDGKILRRHPAYEQVFQPAFTPDGASVAYAVKEGPRLLWKVEKLP